MVIVLCPTYQQQYEKNKICVFKMFILMTEQRGVLHLAAVTVILALRPRVGLVFVVTTSARCLNLKQPI